MQKDKRFQQSFVHPDSLWAVIEKILTFISDSPAFITFMDA